MNLTTTATYGGVTATYEPPEFERVVHIVYRLRGGEVLRFPTDDTRSVETIAKHAPRTVTITAEEE